MLKRHSTLRFYGMIMAGVLSAPAMLFSMGQRPADEKPAAQEQVRETKSYRELTEEAPPVDARDTQIAAGVIGADKKNP